MLISSRYAAFFFDLFSKSNDAAINFRSATVTDYQRTLFKVR
ncbi:hypothetical protein [Vibrio splendidus]|nr:hypothetical protein [Vibrio splendidus]